MKNTIKALAWQIGIKIRKHRGVWYRKLKGQWVVMSTNDDTVYQYLTSAYERANTRETLNDL